MAGTHSIQMEGRSRGRQTPWIKASEYLILILAVTVLSACVKTYPSFDHIRPPVETLYANYRELDHVRSEILTLGNRYFWGSEGTLENVHAVVRCIEQANLIAFYQWRLLSITDYIHPDRLEDFFP